MKPNRRQSLGKRGEALAAEFLEHEGFSILTRNFRTPYGEIDLIAKQADLVVFVEVKTRSSTSLGPPEISITSLKKEHIRCAAEYYIQQHEELQNDWRIDAVTIQLSDRSSPAQIDHFENIV
jgi:putative endonuclease